jgi:hypothetical protein
MTIFARVGGMLSIENYRKFIVKSAARFGYTPAARPFFASDISAIERLVNLPGQEEITGAYTSEVHLMRCGGIGSGFFESQGRYLSMGRRQPRRRELGQGCQLGSL